MMRKVVLCVAERDAFLKTEPFVSQELQSQGPLFLNPFVTPFFFNYAAKVLQMCHVQKKMGQVQTGSQYSYWQRQQHRSRCIERRCCMGNQQNV